MSEKSNKRGLVRWLVFAVVVTALISTTTLSRYMTTITGHATATVASVDMNVAESAARMMSFDISGLKPGGQMTYTFNICNFSGNKASEVTMDYLIRILSTGNLPLSFSLEAAGADTEDSKMAGALQMSSGESGWITASAGRLPHSVKTTHMYTLTVTWPSEANDAKYANEIDSITIHVDAQQSVPETVSDNSAK